MRGTMRSAISVAVGILAAFCVLWASLSLACSIVTGEPVLWPWAGLV